MTRIDSENDTDDSYSLSYAEKEDLVKEYDNPSNIVQIIEELQYLESFHMIIPLLPSGYDFGIYSVDFTYLGNLIERDVDEDLMDPESLLRDIIQDRAYSIPNWIKMYLIHLIQENEEGMTSKPLTTVGKIQMESIQKAKISIKIQELERLFRKPKYVLDLLNLLPKKDREIAHILILNSPLKSYFKLSISKTNISILLKLLKTSRNFPENIQKLTGKAVNWIELQAQLLAEQNGQTIPDYMKMLMLQSITQSPEILAKSQVQENLKGLEALYDDPNYVNDLRSKLKLPISIIRAEGLIENEVGWLSNVRSRLILRDFIKTLSSLDGLSMPLDELVELLGSDYSIHTKKMTKSDKIILLHKIRDADVMPERPDVNHDDILKLIKENCESLLNDDNMLRPGSLRNTGKISENEEEIMISPNKIGGYKKVDETPIVIKKKSIEEKLLGNLEQNKGNINLHNSKEWEEWIKSELPELKKSPKPSGAKESPTSGTPSSLKLDKISREFDPILQEIKGKDPGFMKSTGESLRYTSMKNTELLREFNVPGAKGVLLWDDVTGLPILTDGASVINFGDKNAPETSIEDILADAKDTLRALKNEPTLYTDFPAKKMEASHESKILDMIFHKDNQPKVDRSFNINSIFQSKSGIFPGASKAHEMDSEEDQKIPEKDPVETLIDDFSGVLKKFVKEHEEEIGELFGKIGSFFSNLKGDL